MPSVELRLYEELNDYLPEHRRRRSFDLHIDDAATVRDLIESLGVPPAEVDLVLVADAPVPFSHQVSGGERIAVFPVFERFDISAASRLRRKPLRNTRFVADNALGALARLLRLAGFDCLYDAAHSDLDIVARSSQEKRIIVSRDEALLRHGRITHAYHVREDNPPAQFREIIDAFDLRRSLRPFSRCLDCNGHLLVADESEVLDQVPFAVMVAFDDFWRCEQCHRVYWKGSHYRQLARLIESI